MYWKEINVQSYVIKCAELNTLELNFNDFILGYKKNVKKILPWKYFEIVERKFVNFVSFVYVKIEHQ